IIPVNVMAPTMQVACKAFIAPTSAARSPKERYTHVPHSPRRHARCFLVECPTRGDGQDWDGSHLLELLLNATSLSPLATAKAPLGPPVKAFRFDSLSIPRPTRGLMSPRSRPPPMF